MDDRELLPEAETIEKLASRLRISEDKATILLVHYKWDDKKFTSEFILSYEYKSFSRYLVIRPEYDVKMRLCQLCGCLQLSQNVGCGHYCCNDCLQEYLENQISNGELNILCPHTPCGKFVAPSLIRDIVSNEAEEKFDYTLKSNMINAKQEDVKVESILTSAMDKGKGFMNAIWENRNMIAIMALTSTLSKVELVTFVASRFKIFRR